MGWDIHLKTNKRVTAAVINEIICELPASLKNGLSRQTWGWSMAVDVRLEPGGLHLSGSYSLSGKIAEFAAEAFARRLEQRGFKVEVEPLV